MATEIGEAREAWGRDVWDAAEDFAGKVKFDGGFYVVFAAKQDQTLFNTFRQCFKAYKTRPPLLIGVLVWFVDKFRGIFQLVPELSIPPDVPINPELLSNKAEDQLPSVMENGERANVLLA